jgi:hypothetical protein
MKKTRILFIASTIFLFIFSLIFQIFVLSKTYLDLSKEEKTYLTEESILEYQEKINKLKDFFKNSN